MKNKTLKLDNPCQEKWENMTPNDMGGYCASCSKNVIDFTQLNQVEISQLINESGNGICARLTKTQLHSPVLTLDNNFEFNVPKSKVAAGLALVTSLTIGSTSCSETPTIKTEIVQSLDSVTNSTKEKSNFRTSEQRSDSVTVFKGKVNCADLELPVENAKITFVTAHKLLSTHTAKDGTFSLEIPNDIIDDDNVVRLSYLDVKEEKEREGKYFYGYETKDYILSKEELTSEYSIEAELEMLYLGGIGIVSEKKKPIVLSNGVEIKYREFVKAQRGEESSCSLENKNYLHFYGKYAVAIYGKKAKDGLYILVEE